MAISDVAVIEIIVPGPKGGALDVYDDNSLVASHVTEIDFSTNLSVVDEGGGKVRVASAGGGGGNLPIGGDINDILVKQSTIDGDAIWKRAAVGIYDTAIADYVIGDFVTYQSVLYHCIQDNPPIGTTPPNPTYWEDVTQKSTNAIAITFWSSTKSDYQINDKVTYLSKIYNCTALPPVGTPPTDTDYWEDLSSVGNPAITFWDPTKNDYNEDDRISYQGFTYRANRNSPSLTPPDQSSDWTLQTHEASYTLPTTTQYDNGPYGDVITVGDALDVLTEHRYFELDFVDANSYRPRSILAKQPRWSSQLIGKLKSAGAGINERGCYVVAIDDTMGDITLLGEGDAVALIQDPAYPDVGPYPDSDDAYCIDNVYGNDIVVFNRQILKGQDYNPDDDWYLYKFEFDYRQEDGTGPLVIPKDSYVQFTGQGMVGYPYPKKTVQPSDIATTNEVGLNVFWTHFGQTNSQQRYGVEETDTGQRPDNLITKDNLLDIKVEQFSTYIGEERYIVNLTPGNTTITLQNNPVNNLYVVPNRFPVNINEPNSYTIYNVNNSGIDLIVIYGDAGTNPKFTSNDYRLVELGHVIIDSDEIQSVNDHFWLSTGGGYESSVNFEPKVDNGFLLEDNGTSIPTEPVKYTLTEGTIINSENERIDYKYPEQVKTLQIWPDGDNKVIAQLQRDGRWYDESATIPDPLEPNPRHALIPFGSFSVDFLYMYDSPESYWDVIVYKGSTLYDALDLQQGIEFVSSGIPSNIDNYLPVAALVQLGSGERTFHQIIDIRNYTKESNIKIQTEELLQDLSAKTQFRTEQNLLSKIGYNSALQLGDPDQQGWNEVIGGTNTIAPVPDPADGATTLEFDTTQSAANYMSRLLIRPNIDDLYNFGGSVSLRVKPDTENSNTSGEYSMDILPTDDPKATETYFQFPEPNPEIPFIPYAVHDSTAPPLTVTSTGEISFSVQGLNVLTRGTIISGADNKFQIKQVNGTVFEVYVDGVIISSGPEWVFNGTENNKTVTFRRSGNDVQFLVEGVLRATATAPDADNWVVTTIGAADRGSDIYDDFLESFGLIDLNIQENSVSTPRIYQMKTRSPAFEANVISDGSFEIVDYSPTFWKARNDLSGIPFWDENKADYETGDEVQYAGAAFECILDNPPVGSPPLDNATYWQQIAGIQRTGMFLRWTTDGTDTTITLIRDDVDIIHTYLGQTGYFDIDIALRGATTDWGNIDFTTIPPSGPDDGQTNENIEWVYTGFDSITSNSDLRISTGVIANEFGRKFFLRNYELGIFRTDSTIFLTSEDFVLNNIFVAEGNRDWTFVLPPYTNQVGELNSPNASSVSLKIIGEGSYLVKRPDLSEDVLVNNMEFVQGVYSGSTYVDLTTEDDYTSLGYVNYTLTDLVSGAGGIVPPTPPTEAINVSYDPTGTPLTSTNVQTAITELAVQAGTVEERLSVNAAMNDAINLTDLTIPSDYLTNGAIQAYFNGEQLDKGTNFVRVNSTSFRLPDYDSIAGEDIFKLINYPS